MIYFERTTVEDAEDIMKIKIRAFGDDVRLYGYGPPGYDSMENLLKNITNGIHYKMVDENRIIGGMCLFDMGYGHFHLGGIYIDPNYQNKGIGAKAIKFLFSEYENIKKWSLDTPYLSFRNHHFYEKLGFVKVGRTKPEPDGFYLFLYEKTC